MYPPSAKRVGGYFPFALIDRVLGRMLNCHNYLPQKISGGKRGCFVVEHGNSQADARKIVEDYKNQIVADVADVF